MDFGWVIIFFANDHGMVEVITALLDSEDIPACVLNHDDPKLSVFGEFEIFVREDHRAQAVAVIEQCKMSFS